jgi:hypothetical protein
MSVRSATGTTLEPSNPSISEGRLRLVTLPVDQLVPNDYNPNVLAAGEFAELVAEVRHLGRLPKRVSYLGRSAWNHRRQLLEAELQASGPAFIKDSRLPIEHKYAVWHTETPPWLDPKVADDARRKLALLSRLALKPKESPEDGVRRAFHFAAKYARAKDIYIKRPPAALGRYIAERMPMYRDRSALDTERIAVVAGILAQLTKAELVCLAESAERWDWEEQFVALLRSMRPEP